MTGTHAPVQGLAFVIEPYRLMIDALRVQELVPRFDAGRIGGGGHLAWRDRLVPVIGLAELLGRPGGRHTGSDEQGVVDVIYGDRDGGLLACFAVDRVLGLCRPEPADVRSLPPLPPAAATLFAGIVLDRVSNGGILWLDAGAGALLDLWRKRNQQ